jgi:fructosamine-3-kinase
VPEVYLVGADFLLMQYCAPGAAQPKLAGEALARMHCEQQPTCGFDRPTYLATLLQDNTPHSSWSDFVFLSRFDPQLRALSVDSENEMKRWKAFYEAARPLLDSCPFFSLLHGDLWAGNLYYGDLGPVFIDPAVYRGDSLIDIAMTKLFGGFSKTFYDAYFANISPRPALQELLKIYEIYPLLVHARLFGGGYYQAAASIRDSFI